MISRLYCRFWHQFINAYGFFREGDSWVCSECFCKFAKISFTIGSKGEIK